ncbi:putative toxin-antitoxin system toxin component, PIN family [Desulforhopalus sp. IMCC35007]|uniref:putative toxin-antitoxin system toxin component, PIN family n=1 Tax=Desulforhopalus sp. IMCC35007 TaxID=2569543 RepID=UPI00197AB253|nr:putative toxin-antitoxin system toxin component, PIN family [Desulforhopalus sp. IMCC35007]
MRYHNSMKKIVLDTSVFVSALLGPKGASRAVLRGCLEKKYTPLMGNALFQEYEDLVKREQLFRNCPLSLHERNTLLDAILSICQWVTIYYGWRPTLRDEADNHLIELGIAGGASFLITKNIKDFKNPELQFPQLKVIDPVSFIKEV